SPFTSPAVLNSTEVDDAGRSRVLSGVVATPARAAEPNTSQRAAIESDWSQRVCAICMTVSCSKVTARYAAPARRSMSTSSVINSWVAPLTGVKHFTVKSSAVASLAPAYSALEIDRRGMRHGGLDLGGRSGVPAGRRPRGLDGAGAGGVRA